MATQFELDCALMAGLAYQTNRDKINWFPAPEGWQQFSHIPADQRGQRHLLFKPMNH